MTKEGMLLNFPNVGRSFSKSDLKVWIGSYLVLITKAIAVTCIKDDIGPEYLGTWVSHVSQHDNVGFGKNVTNRSLCYSVSVLVPCR